jgi:hypothetical protein
MTNKSEHPRVDDIGITRQLSAFKLAHEAIAKTGELTSHELGIVLRCGDVFAAVAGLAAMGDKGLTRLEVQGLLSQAQTMGMLLVGAIHEGNGQDSDLRSFYRRTVGPSIRSIEEFENAHDADCAACKAELSATGPATGQTVN